MTKIISCLELLRNKENCTKAFSLYTCLQVPSSYMTILLLLSARWGQSSCSTCKFSDDSLNVSLMRLGRCTFIATHSSPHAHTCQERFIEGTKFLLIKILGIYVPLTKTDIQSVLLCRKMNGTHLKWKGYSFIRKLLLSLLLLRGREIKRERVPIYWVTPQMHTTVEIKLGQDPEILSGNSRPKMIV